MNRFKLAKQLNFNDELIWHVKHQGRQLKCLWRNNTCEDLTSKGKVEMTFVAQWEDSNKVYVVYTLEFPK